MVDAAKKSQSKQAITLRKLKTAFLTNTSAQATNTSESTSLVDDSSKSASGKSAPKSNSKRYKKSETMAGQETPLAVDQGLKSTIDSHSDPSNPEESQLILSNPEEQQLKLLHDFRLVELALHEIRKGKKVATWDTLKNVVELMSGAAFTLEDMALLSTVSPSAFVFEWRTIPGGIKGGDGGATRLCLCLAANPDLLKTGEKGQNRMTLFR